MYTAWKYITLAFLFIPIISYASLPESIPAEGHKQIIVDPKQHKWGAYDEDGNLVRSGTATTGANYCRDVGRSCRTSVGTFRIKSLGSASCKSRKFPLPDGGAPMPYCMFFHNGEAFHGSNHVVRANRSHGCVRMHKKDAKWLRYNFAEEPTLANERMGTLVVVKPY